MFIKFFNFIFFFLFSFPYIILLVFYYIKNKELGLICRVTLVYIQDLISKRTRYISSNSVLHRARYFMKVVVRRKTSTYAQNKEERRETKCVV